MLNQAKFLENLYRLEKNPKDKTYLLALSGGADSMVLASLMVNAGFKVQIATVNYKLRGNDSDLDQKVVEDFCKKNTLKYHIYEVSEKDKKPENSIQLWARNLRYNFFFKILKEEYLDYIVTAHHLNDDLETFLIHLSRGSGIRGLSGIPELGNQILRPLLKYSKEEIYDFAKVNKVEFREDASNQKNDYLRNRIRNEVVPHLVSGRPNFLDNFSKSVDLLSQAKTFLDEKINEILNKITSEKDGFWVINKAKLKSESDFVQFEILRKFGFDDEKEINKIFDAENGKTFLSKDYLLTIDRTTLLIYESKTMTDHEEEIIDLEINTKNEIIIPEKIKGEIQSKNAETWHFDPEKLVLPLKLRHKKERDVFFPIGMIGKKKVSKFFRDEKISILAKSKIWLLVDADERILGVLPFRQDRRFLPETETNNKLNLNL